MNLHSIDNLQSVDFVTNVFERTYRDVLQPGQIERRVAPHGFRFAKRVVLVNNVNDRADVLSLLDPLLASGEVTEAHFVADRLDAVLEQAGLLRTEIEKTIHYTDCALVGIFLPGSPYILYSDADVHLAESRDWISPALLLMQQDERVAVANPDWTPSTLDSERRESTGDFSLSYGFSDQLFLVRRGEFAAPIYKNWAPISWRYPLSHVVPIFEQRVDSYMRIRHRLRATYVRTCYFHGGDEGAGYRVMGTTMKWKRRLMQGVVKLCQLTPGSNPIYHV